MPLEGEGLSRKGEGQRSCCRPSSGWGPRLMASPLRTCTAAGWGPSRCQWVTPGLCTAPRAPGRPSLTTQEASPHQHPCCPLCCFSSTSREGASTGSGGTRVLRALETCKGQSVGGREQHRKYSRCPGTSPLPTPPRASLDSQLHRAKAYQAEAPRRDRDRHSARPHLWSRPYERRQTHWEVETQVLPEGEQQEKDTLSSLPPSPPRPLRCHWWETRSPQCPRVAAMPLHLCRHPP